MAGLDFVDCYLHCMDPTNPLFPVPTLQPGITHPSMGRAVDTLKGRSHPVSRYIKECRGANVVAAVYMDVWSGAKDTVDETAWVQAQADRHGFPQAICTAVDLQSPRIEQELLRHLQYSNFRGVRFRTLGGNAPGPHLGAPHWSDSYWTDRAFLRGYALLRKYSLVFAGGGGGSVETARQIRDLAFKFPDVPMCGGSGIGSAPLTERDPEHFFAWKERLAIFAEAPNTYCNISHLSIIDHHWTASRWRPWILTMIELFGPKRIMFGLHWPYDTIFGTAKLLVDAYAEVIKDFTPDEQKDMLSRNALKLFRIDRKKLVRTAR